MELTLTVQGSPAELQRVLSLVDAVSDERHPGEISDHRLFRIVATSSPPMIEALLAIVSASARDEAIERTDLASAAGLSGEGELNGVLGSIGRAWARHIGGDNPFLGSTGAEGSVLYRIDRTLAERLLPVLEQWRGGIMRGRGGGRRRGRGRGHVE